ncbi:MAG TPA: M48 family metalloprotease [Candidatus Baltobacteraceae bacterium]|nr:M48 family metalloprotease [Candidatus Baltobacteraceae bacterium]
MTLRPNAIDYRLDALSSHMLLSHSAAQLADPARQAAALRLVHWYLPGWFLSVLLPVFGLAYFWRSGHAAALRDALRRRFDDENFVRFVFGAVLGAIVRIAALLPSLYLYRLERLMSQSDQLLRSWSIDWILITLLWMLVVGVVTAGVLWLVDRTHQWYLYTIGIILALSFAVAYLSPVVAAPFEQIVPMPPRTLAAIRAIETRAHMAIPVVEQIRVRSHVGTAYVAGLGATQRIVIGNAIVEVTSARELQYVIARQLGFIANGAPWKVALIDALLLIVGAAIAVAIADRFGFRRDDDPVSRFALLGAFFGVLYLFAVPGGNALLRGISLGADGYALSLHVNRAAAVRNVVRATDESLTEVCPDILARVFLQRAPDPAVRVHDINNVVSTCPP